MDAGSDLFLTISFGGNRSRLNLHGQQHQAAEFSQISAEIGREVADSCGRSVIFAGSVGPTDEIMEPNRISFLINRSENFSLANMEWCGTMSFDTAGRTMFGIAGPELVELISKIPNKPIAFRDN